MPTSRVERKQPISLVGLLEKLIRAALVKR
jgi:hypothetical protein